MVLRASRSASPPWLGIGASTLVLGVATNPLFFLAANVVSGMFNGVMMITFPTLMQATTPDALRGRVSSVMMTVMGGTMPLAMGLAGIAADAVDQNVPVLFIVSSRRRGGSGDHHGFQPELPGVPEHADRGVDRRLNALGLCRPTTQANSRQTGVGTAVSQAMSVGRPAFSR